MKEIALGLLGLAACTLQAARVSVPPLPPPAFADTEVATNVGLTVDARWVRTVSLGVELDAAPTNNLEVAVGRDANGNGVLELEETAWVFGYDCGSWFLRSTDGVDERRWMESAPTGHVMRVFSIRRREWNDSWDLLKVVRRGWPMVNEQVFVEQDCPGLMIRVL